MKITVFTSNQPRHISLVESLCEIADEVFSVHESNTVFPGEIQDFFQKTEVMKDYFSRVITAETQVFGRPRFLPKKARALCLKGGDLNRLELAALKPALESDYYVVFGASFIKGGLCDFLVDHGALNIHMGVSPYYRGNSCNFWALYDGRPDLVGATIHLLTKGLDSGPLLFHTLPKAQAVDGFTLGMLAVKAAHLGLVNVIQEERIRIYPPLAQDKSKQIRYAKNADFTDAVASEYLKRLPSPESTFGRLKDRDVGLFTSPFIQ